MKRLWMAAVVAGIMSSFVNFLLPGGGIGQAVVYTAMTLAVGGLIELGLHLHKPDNRLPWHLLAGGFLTYGMADVIWHTAPPFPSLADAFYLAAYALFIAGLAVLVRKRTA